MASRFNLTPPFVWLAWLGVVTTAANTALPILTQLGAGGSEAAAILRAWREPILLVHAIATLLPMLGLGLLVFERMPFAAVTAMSFTAIEKALELIGQALRVFPPEEVLGGVPVRAIVAAVWDQLYSVLWLCNTLGAAAAGCLLLQLLPGALGRAAAVVSWLAAALTALLIAGPDYLDLAVPAVAPWIFALVFTLYRVAIAVSLTRATREDSK